MPAIRPTETTHHGVSCRESSATFERSRLPSRRPRSRRTVEAEVSSRECSALSRGTRRGRSRRSRSSDRRPGSSKRWLDRRRVPKPTGRMTGVRCFRIPSSRPTDRPPTTTGAVPRETMEQGPSKRGPMTTTNRRESGTSSVRNQSGRAERPTSRQSAAPRQRAGDEMTELPTTVERSGVRTTSTVRRSDRPRRPPFRPSRRPTRRREPASGIGRGCIATDPVTHVATDVRTAPT